MITGGGTERQLSEFAKAIDRDRFEPHVVCFKCDSAKADELTAHGVKVVQIPVTSYAGQGIHRHAAAFYRYVRRHGIQLFHAFDMPLAIFGAPLARMAGVPVVLTSVRGRRELHNATHQRLLTVTDRLTDGIVANSTSLVDHLLERGVPRHLLRLCHNGLDLSRFPHVDRDPTRPLTIGSVSMLRPEKNLDLLIRAFALLENRESLRLRLTGSGSMLESLVATAGSLGIERLVSFQPATVDVAPEYRKIDIFVLPSLSEGLSNSIMEAMACECCVAASAVGGNLELVENEVRGLLFDPSNVDSLANVLRRLTTDAVLRQRLAQRGAAFIREGFSMDRSARTMEAIYDSYLAV
jgi:glycosyltransferase involved in cell wall biosynthesis